MASLRIAHFFAGMLWLPAGIGCGAADGGGLSGPPPVPTGAGGVIGAGGNAPTSGGAGQGGASSGGFAGGFNPFPQGDSGGMECGGNPYRGEATELDIYIMLDRSGSMIGQPGPADVWTPITGAISNFTNLPEAAGIGVGVQFFGINFESCNAADYANPAAPIAPLPGNAGAIQQAMTNNAPFPLGLTPTLPALTGATQHARQHAMANPGKKVIVVLATDGEPNICNSTIQAVAQVAAEALAGGPSIETYVIGIGNIAGLDQVAAAGGTERAFEVGLDPSLASQQFLEVMNQIRGAALPCDYAIPNEAGSDPTQVNLDFTPAGAASPTRIGYAQSASDCGSDLGWYYDNPTSPTRVITCPATCETLKRSNGAQIDVVVGCARVPIR